MDQDATVRWARSTSERLLGPLGRRWVHVQQVAKVASIVGRCLPDDRDTLIAAAYLHDIGYAPALKVTGFHPLDGGRYVQKFGYEFLARLVAHHSGARIEARRRGFENYTDEFVLVNSPLDQALTYCDLTTGPDGASVTLDERVAEINDRYGSEHVMARSITMCLPELRQAVAATEERMTEAGVGLACFALGVNDHARAAPQRGVRTALGTRRLQGENFEHLAVCPARGREAPRTSDQDRPVDAHRASAAASALRADQAPPRRPGPPGSARSSREPGRLRLRHPARHGARAEESHPNVDRTVRRAGSPEGTAPRSPPQLRQPSHGPRSAPRIVMEIVGHSGIEMTMNVYGHVNLDNQRKALESLDEELS